MGVGFGGGHMGGFAKATSVASSAVPIPPRR
jgi:hypothetical protein